MRERNSLGKERDGLRRVEARWEHNGGFKGVRDRDKGKIRLLEERGIECWEEKEERNESINRGRKEAQKAVG